MGSHGDIEGDDFFDTLEVFAEMSDSSSDCSSNDCSTSGFGNDYWVGKLDSVDERRDRFLQFMGLNSKWLGRDRENEDADDNDNDSNYEMSAITTPVLPQNSDFQDGFLSRQPSLSCWSNNEFPRSGSVKEDTVVETNEDVAVKSSFDFTADGSTEWNASASSSQRSSRKEGPNGTLLDRRKKGKKGWLQKLNVMAGMVDKQVEPSTLKPKGVVRVHTHKKKSKELSSLYATQDFPAHTGSISTIKFSHNGRYLATAGADAIVRIWEISEDEDPRKYDMQRTDPSSFYFSTNHLSELAPVKEEKGKTRKITGFRKSSELACVILPPKVFRILDEPVHEFHGHGGEILSLSWSKNGYLLSSSVDQSVRMWKIGHNECLKTFVHNNYVTCAEFNPVDENQFISGSIDGKVRIWEVDCCQVVDWIDVTEIVTAVCYCPDGKGAIVGTLDGYCSFYDIIDNRLQLHAQICLMSKKKWPRRITAFQFCPIDSKKVIVSSADSQVRILCGINIVGKFKGNRSSGGQMSASFTSDGKHIVSAAEDSNVYVWNHHATSDKPATKPKTNPSCENFFSRNASVAVPWCGIKSIAAALPSPLPAGTTTPTTDRRNNAAAALPRSTIDSPRMPPPSSSNRGFFLESLLKGPPTWPAEVLPETTTQVSVSPSMRKSEYRFLKSAYQSTFVAPHMWGLVIVVAGLDGRIRTYVNYGLPIRL